MSNVMQIDAKKFGRVAVLMGGLSAEREVSLVSGQRVLEALLQKGIEAFVIDVGRDITEHLTATKPDRVFIALHGTYGEDGRIQSLLEWMNIPYTGSGVLASALAMDKEKTKMICALADLPVLPSLMVSDVKNEDFIKDLADFILEVGFPLCVKPLDSGSSCGVTRVENEEQLAAAYAKALQYADKIIIEPWVHGREFTVGIIDQETLPPLEIVVKRDFYDYAAKYEDNATQFICPCDLNEEQKAKLQKITLQTFKVLGCRHFGRADFIMDRDGNFWLLEMNTIPGLTSHSLVPQAAAVAGIDFPDLMVRILSFTL